MPGSPKDKPDKETSLDPGCGGLDYVSTPNQSPNAQSLGQ